VKYMSGLLEAAFLWVENRLRLNLSINLDSFPRCPTICAQRTPVARVIHCDHCPREEVRQITTRTRTRAQRVHRKESAKSCNSSNREEVLSPRTCIAAEEFRPHFKFDVWRKAKQSSHIL